MKDWYHHRIMDHYRNRRHSTPLPDPMVRHTEANPLCGDSLTADIIIRDGLVADIALHGSGCVMSQASASLLSQEIYSRSIAECMQFSDADILKLVGVEVGPMRMGCVTLSLRAVQKGIAQCLTMNKS